MAETAPEARHAQIVDTIKRMDSENPLDKKPSVNAIGTAVGYQVSAEERDKAWNEFRPVEQPRVTPDPRAKFPQVTNKSESPIRIDPADKPILPGETRGVMNFDDYKENSHSVKMMLELGVIAEA
jgi:hypothetical protein